MNQTVWRFCPDKRKWVVVGKVPFSYPIDELVVGLPQGTMIQISMGGLVIAALTLGYPTL